MSEREPLVLARSRAVRDIVEKALACEDAHREQLLAECCHDDDTLMEEVVDLLGLVRAETDSSPVFNRVVGFLDLCTPNSRAREADITLKRLVSDTGAAAGNRYEILGPIGRGGMGVVRRARDLLLHREVAIKTLRARHGVLPGNADGQRTGRFLDEAQITAQLDHPGIVPIHDLGIDQKGRLFYSMPVVRGIGLDEAIRRTRDDSSEMSLTRVLGEILKACQAVAFAHSRGVLHRDLKPSNIMIGSYGQVYVLDWGLARPDGTSANEVVSDFRELGGPDSSLYTRGGSILGTIGYMSPEQVRGRSDAGLDARSDVYSMGAILYELLTGAAPYLSDANEALNMDTYRARISAGAPRRLDGPPAELIAICERAMERQVGDRYESMEGLSSDLRAYLEGRVVQAHSTGPWVEARKWIQRNRPLAGSLCAALVFLVLGLVATGFLYVQATEKGDEVLRLATLGEIVDLGSRADELWPIAPDKVEAYEAWLRDAERLLAQLGPASESGTSGYRAQLARVAVPHSGTALESRTVAERTLHDQLARVVRDLEELTDPLSGLMRGTSSTHGWGIERRLMWAREVARRTVEGDEAQKLWAEAIASISDHHAKPEYGGMVIRPQLGLLPIGPDPLSGLWEFAVLQTGEVPSRKGDSLMLEAGTAMVLVLLPGGRFLMGAQGQDPNGKNYDPQSIDDDEQPVREVWLTPFFISKYEMTQGQWLNATGSNPSEMGPDSHLWLKATRRGSLTHPVEYVTWDDCHRATSMLDLSLPSEEQWEYAARAGSDTPWHVGSEAALLRHVANIADVNGRNPAQADRIDFEPWDDGHLLTAPVASYEANRFGLHSVSGNVWEWCLNEYEAKPERDSTDPLTGGSPFKKRPVRGGSYFSKSAYARSAERQGYREDAKSGNLGLRPARPVRGIERFPDFLVRRR